jgi:hypothetical protein
MQKLLEIMEAAEHGYLKELVGAGFATSIQNG